MIEVLKKVDGESEETLIGSGKFIWGTTFLVVSVLAYIYSFELFEMRLQEHISSGNMNAPLLSIACYMGYCVVGGLAGFLMVDFVDFFKKTRKLYK